MCKDTLNIALCQCPTTEDVLGWQCLYSYYAIPGSLGNTRIPPTHTPTPYTPTHPTPPPQRIFFNVQFSYWLQEFNVPPLPVNKGTNTVNACRICVHFQLGEINSSYLILEMYKLLEAFQDTNHANPLIVET